MTPLPFREIKTDRPLKRHDVVTERGRLERGGYMMGRVWKRIDEHHVAVVDTGYRVIVYEDKDLALTNYTGTWALPHPGKNKKWIPMPSLRILKKRCVRYNAHFGGRCWTRLERKRALAELVIGEVQYV